MRMFLMGNEKKEVKCLKQLERLHIRKMTKEELDKIEYAERLRDYRRVLFISIFALCVSILNFIFVIISRL